MHSSTDYSKSDVEKGVKRSVPPSLKLENREVPVGEKSPEPASVYDLFKKYNRKGERCEKQAGDDVNVRFDEMTSDDKSGFLRKLQRLTVSKKKDEHPGGHHHPNAAGRILNKFVPRRSSVTKATSPSRHTPSSSSLNVFARGKKEPSSGDKSKKSARRLQFTGEHCVEKQKQVVALTREYEKMKGVPIKSPGTTASPAKSWESTTTEEKSYSEETKKAPASTTASWNGELPPRDYTSPTFSRKIFVGGVPWDITEAALKDSFGEFGACAVEWPGQEARYRSGTSSVVQQNGTLRHISKYAGQAATGYVYMIFEDERAVAALLHECSQEIGGAGEWYFKIRAQRSKSTEIRQVQIIPWVTSDSLYCEDESLLETGIEPKRTVFVGALHGMMTAQVLHAIMEDCFGGVECVQLDTDKFKYPIGSGRVTFREHGAYFKAIEIGYLHVHTSKFRKRVQIDPFLESTSCMMCNLQPAHCFCRNRNCFKYYCHSCWSIDHGKDINVDVHVPVIVPSSATKSYQGPPRRSHLMSHSPAKSQPQSSAPSLSQYAHLLPPAFPMIVGAPSQTLSALYGYVQNAQMMSPHYDGPLTPPCNDGTVKVVRDLQTNPAAVIMNTTPLMSPQKDTPNYFASSPAFLTSSSTYFSSPSHTSAAPFYAAPPPNLYYSYVPQPMPYDSTFVCSPQNYNSQ